jgi:hypothetical protein
MQQPAGFSRLLLFQNPPKRSPSLLFPVRAIPDRLEPKVFFDHRPQVLDLGILGEVKMKETPPDTRSGSTGRMKTVVLVVVIAAVTSAATVWLMSRHLFPKSFQPVTLSQKEEKALANKLERLDPRRPPAEAPRKIPQIPDNGGAKPPPLEPEAYSETSTSREVSFSQREINALIARNTDLAPRLAIDLSENLASARLLVPLDPDMPFLGGKTLRVSAGLALRYAGGKPVVILKGVSLWGVPIPNAWLGGIKNIDLVGEFGAKPGFWQAFAAGVDDIRVADGRITIRLKE